MEEAGKGEHYSLAIRREPSALEGTYLDP